MKHLVAAALTFFTICRLTAQDAGVEKSMFTFQTGLIGFWVNHEARLSNEIALRTELGADLWYYETIGGDKGTFLAPSIGIEPRWYYNIEKRSAKGKHIGNNSANFLTVGFEYYPDSFIIGNHPDFVYVPEQLSIIPKWGMRRAIAKSNFNYELGAGVGYFSYLSGDNNIWTEDSGVAIDLHIRIGYSF